MNYFTDRPALFAAMLIGVWVVYAIGMAVARGIGHLIRFAIKKIAGRRRQSAAQEEPESR